MIGCEQVRYEMNLGNQRIAAAGDAGRVSTLFYSYYYLNNVHHTKLPQSWDVPYFSVPLEKRMYRYEFGLLQEV